jgi:hypothetical protein
MSRTAVLPLALAQPLVSVGAAQINTGEVRGVVGEASGAVLPGATVTAHQLAQPRQLRHSNCVFGTASFGRIFSARQPREMQLGARFSF